MSRLEPYSLQAEIMHQLQCHIKVAILYIVDVQVYQRQMKT